MPSFDDADCSKQYTDAIEAYASIDFDNDNTEDLHRFILLVDKTRACEGPVSTLLFQRLLIREIYVLNHLAAYQEMLSSLGSLGDSLLVKPIDSRKDSVNVAWYYSSKGNAHYFLNDLSKAASSYAQAIRYTPDPILHAQYCLNFGNTLVRMQDIPGAFDSYNTARHILDTIATRDDQWLEVYTRMLGSSADVLVESVGPHYKFSDALSSDTRQINELVPLPLQRHPLEEAIDLLHQTLALSQDPFSPLTIATLLELGDAYTMLGKPTQALPYLLDAKKVALRAKEAHWRYQTQYALGKFYLQTGDLDKAELALQEAYARINDARHSDYKRLSLNVLGLLYERKQDYPQADRFYRQAIDTTEAYYTSLRSTDWATQVSGARYLPYRGRVRALLAQKRYKDAFLQLAYSRARHLQDLQLQSRLADELSPQERVRYDSLIAAQNTTLDALATNTLTASQRTTLKTQEAHLADQLVELQRPTYAVPAPSLEAMQQALQPNQVLISYFIGEEDVNGIPLPSPASSYAFVLSSDSLQFFPLNTSVPNLIHQIHQVSPALADAQNAFDFDTRLFSLHALNDLYHILYAPLASAIPTGARLIIIPDGPLFLLPFNMLVEATADDHDYRAATYLVQKHATSVDLGATLLVNTSNVEPVFLYDLVAFGKSTFSDIGTSSSIRAISVSSDDLPALSGVEREIEHIQSLFRSKVIRMNATAKETSFSSLAAQAAMVHIASHTLLNGKAPLQNAVILSSDPDDQDDGFMYLHEIQRMCLPTRLVVLSGCNTARGVFYPGEGRAGLQYAFRAAGVPSTLATSWFVDDEASATLYASFYRHLRRGLPKDVALQQAQIDYLQKAPPLATSPFFWAAPILYGDVSTLDLDGPVPTWTLLLIFVVLGFLLFLGWRLATRKRALT